MDKLIKVEERLQKVYLHLYNHFRNTDYFRPADIEKVLQKEINEGLNFIRALPELVNEKLLLSKKDENNGRLRLYKIAPLEPQNIKLSEFIQYSSGLFPPEITLFLALLKTLSGPQYGGSISHKVKLHKALSGKYIPFKSLKDIQNPVQIVDTLKEAINSLKHSDSSYSGIFSGLEKPLYNNTIGIKYLVDYVATVTFIDLDIEKSATIEEEYNLYDFLIYALEITEKDVNGTTFLSQCSKDGLELVHLNQRLKTRFNNSDIKIVVQNRNESLKPIISMNLLLSKIVNVNVQVVDVLKTVNKNISDFTISNIPIHTSSEQELNDELLKVSPSLEWAFGQSALQSCRKKAVVFINKPSLFRAGPDKKVREYMLDSNSIEAVIDTGKDTVLLILTKDKPKDRMDKVLFMRLHRSVSEAKLGRIYSNFTSVDNLSAAINISEIKMNDCNLLPEKYIHSSKEKPLRDDNVFINTIHAIEENNYLIRENENVFNRILQVKNTYRISDSASSASRTETITIEDLLVSDGKGYRAGVYTKANTSPEGEIDVLTSESIGKGFLNMLDKKISNDDAIKNSKAFVNGDCDIVISLGGGSIGNSSIIGADSRYFLGTTDLIALSLDKSKVLPQYLFVYFQSPEFGSEMLKNSTGTERRKVGVRAFLKFKVKIPSLIVQEQIASHISKLTDLSNLYKSNLSNIEQLMNYYLPYYFNE